MEEDWVIASPSSELFAIPDEDPPCKSIVQSPEASVVASDIPVPDPCDFVEVESSKLVSVVVDAAVATLSFEAFLAAPPVETWDPKR